MGPIGSPDLQNMLILGLRQDDIFLKGQHCNIDYSIKTSIKEISYDFQYNVLGQLTN